jgi:hypothetical protein
MKRTLYPCKDILLGYNDPGQFFYRNGYFQYVSPIIRVDVFPLILSPLFEFANSIEFGISYMYGFRSS